MSVSAPVVRSGDPITDALRLVDSSGINDPDVARKALAAAIGVSSSASVLSIIGAYLDRGDDDVADLLSQARRTLEHKPVVLASDARVLVDEILELL
jgi:hypothetical protein